MTPTEASRYARSRRLRKQSRRKLAQALAQIAKLERRQVLLKQQAKEGRRVERRLVRYCGGIANGLDNAAGLLLVAFGVCGEPRFKNGAQTLKGWAARARKQVDDVLGGR